MRVLTVFLSGCALGLLYIYALRYSKSLLVALVTVIITSFLPPYLQRTQSLNVDVFLLIGWLGYVLWYKNLMWGAFFLTFGVLSKSLLGYYPVAMIFFYEFIQWVVDRKKGKKEFRVFIQNTLLQVGFSSLWFFWMYYWYRDDFIQYHFFDSHFKRVTASIEQHFGQRTFYIDLLVEQLKYGIVPTLLSILYLSYTYIKKRSRESYFSLIFVPWFLFLNLTKTKIAWYLYPILPQFAYLTIYMLSLIKKQWLQGMVALIFLWFFFSFMVPLSSYMTTNFSTWEDHQRIAQDAKKAKCKSLHVLVSENTRTSYKTLKSMDLVIHTTTWWGNHPSMAYYADIPTHYYYSGVEFEKRIFISNDKNCFTAEREDWAEKWGLRIFSKNAKFYLGITIQK